MIIEIGEKMTNMNMIYDDSEFFLIATEILSNEEFKKLDNYIQHGNTTRLEHSLRVAYKSYKMAKKMAQYTTVDITSTTRAALLHDFFFEQDKSTIKSKIKNLIVHPKIAICNANSHFSLSTLEENIMKTHMFPFSKKPKCIEGWIVTTADKVSTIGEVYKKAKSIISTSLNRNRQTSKKSI